MKISRIQRSVLFLAGVAFGLTAAPDAFAATVTDINFACSGSITGANATGLYASSSPSTNLCNTTVIVGASAQDKYGPGHNLPTNSSSSDIFSKWTQAAGNITVAGSGLGWNQNQGEANADCSNSTLSIF